jgi:hypothetical protein
VVKTSSTRIPHCKRPRHVRQTSLRCQRRLRRASLECEPAHQQAPDSATVWPARAPARRSDCSRAGATVWPRGESGRAPTVRRLDGALGPSAPPCPRRRAAGRRTSARGRHVERLAPARLRISLRRAPRATVHTGGTDQNAVRVGHTARTTAVAPLATAAGRRDTRSGLSLRDSAGRDRSDTQLEGEAVRPRR